MASDPRRTEHVKARESDRASTSEGARRRGGTQGRVTDLYIKSESVQENGPPERVYWITAMDFAQL